MRNTGNNHDRFAFTLIELLIVLAIIGILAAILFPVFASARDSARSSACLSNERQIGMATRMYMQDFDGAFFHHHEGWVLDDGTQVDSLPTDTSGCDGGGQGNSNAEKPWAIFIQPYCSGRQIMFCPSDTTSRSSHLTTNIQDYNGGIEELGSECSVSPDGELCIAETQNKTMWSYLLNSIFTHKSCRYAKEGVLGGFATEDAISSLENPNVIMYSERNSSALNATDNNEFGYVPQDDYDTWAGEGALVRWGEGKYGDQGWIKYDRHRSGANYIYADGHAKFLKWGKARLDQFPDHQVRRPLANHP